MRRYWFPKPYADAVARLRVPSGFLMVALFLWLSNPSFASLSLGLPISVAGLWLRGWAAGHLVKNERLATSGPYAYVRNPLYLGTLAVAAGLAFAARSLLLGAVFALFFLLVYLPVIEQEEQHLGKLFPEFKAYAARVPLLLPRFGASSGDRFRWSVYRRNREYQALAGFLAGAVVLLWKAF